MLEYKLYEEQIKIKNDTTRNDKNMSFIFKKKGSQVVL